MALTAAGTDQLLGAWAVTPMDPNDQYGLDGRIITSRGEWQFDNDTITRAISETLVSNVVGPTGLRMRSAYRADPMSDDQFGPQDEKVRRQIDERIKAGTRGTRFDANGLLTRRQMSQVMIVSLICNGIAISLREWQPNRPGRPSHATCWRIIHPMRLSNPGFVPNNHQFRDGFEIDENKNPIAIHIQKTHPYTVWNLQQFKWVRVPLVDPDGFPNATIYRMPRICEQLRPLTMLSPMIQLMRLYDRTLEAKTVADAMQASMGLIIECDDPAKAARSDRSGVELTARTKIRPGQKYFVKKGTVVTALNFGYKGEDFDKWTEVVLTNVCASIQVPFEFVMQRLTKSNMASSRVALSQAYQTFHGWQEDLIASVEAPWNESLIREDVLRGRVDLPIPQEHEEWDGIMAAHYMRPARMMPDPKKEVDAQVTWVKELAKSYSSAFSDAGMSFDDQTNQRERDDKLLEDRDIVLESSNAPPEENEDGEGGEDKPKKSDDDSSNAPIKSDDKAEKPDARAHRVKPKMKIKRSRGAA